MFTETTMYYVQDGHQALATQTCLCNMPSCCTGTAASSPGAALLSTPTSGRSTTSLTPLMNSIWSDDPRVWMSNTCMC